MGTSRFIRPSRWLALGIVVAVIGLTGLAQSPSTADPGRGKAVFEKCAACHALDDAPDGGAAPAGPSLKGVFGRKAASRDDFRYSPAMTRSGVVWTPETLDAYLADPQAFLRGNRMSFAGIVEKSERDDLIAYLAEATRTDP